MMKMLPELPDVVAPDGSDVRILSGTARGSMAHFTLAPGKTSQAVRHRTVEEIWYVLQGQGEMWIESAEGEATLQLRPGLSFSIATGCSFQFRNTGSSPLRAVAITMPPWPGEDEAEPVNGKWQPLL